MDQPNSQPMIELIEGETIMATCDVENFVGKRAFAEIPCSLFQQAELRGREFKFNDVRRMNINSI